MDIRSISLRNSSPLVRYVTSDGLADRDGNIALFDEFDYASTPLGLISYKMDNSGYVPKEMDPILRQYGEAIVKAFAENVSST